MVPLLLIGVFVALVVLFVVLVRRPRDPAARWDEFTAKHVDEETHLTGEVHTKSLEVPPGPPFE